MDNELIWYTPEFLKIAKQNMAMSPETWRKVIAADPSGWREFIEGDNGKSSE